MRFERAAGRIGGHTITKLLDCLLILFSRAPGLAASAGSRIVPWTALRGVTIWCQLSKTHSNPNLLHGDCLENEITVWSKVELWIAGSSALFGTSGCQSDLLETFQQGTDAQNDAIAL